MCVNCLLDLTAAPTAADLPRTILPAEQPPPERPVTRLIYGEALLPGMTVSDGRQWITLLEVRSRGGVSSAIGIGGDGEQYSLIVSDLSLVRRQVQP